MLDPPLMSRSSVILIRLNEKASPSQQMEDFETMLDQCWASVVDGGQW